MTLIVAHVSQQGAVMASDSHVTEEDHTTGSVNKIWASGGLLFGYSGDMSLRDRLRAAIDASLNGAPLPVPTDCEMVQSQLCFVVKPVLEAAYANFVGGPGADPVDSLGGSLVVIGHDAEKFWLLEIDRYNTPTHYTVDGFHTIGSGSVAAHVGRHLLKHYALPGHETQHLRLLAYRTVSSCVTVLGGAYSLGGPVQLWESQPDGGFAPVQGEELAAVEEGLRQWVQIEQESLVQVFNQQEVAFGDPLPEELDSGS